MEAWRLKMEPWRVYRPVVTDSHQFDEAGFGFGSALTWNLDLDPLK
jgi:hypothetical protein